jgi:tetratricopeptide (TPR) repeat protein
MTPLTRMSLALLCALSLTTAVAAAPDSAAALIAKGSRLLEQGKLEPARKAFAAAVKVDPRSVDARMKLAGVNIAQNDFTAAIPLYKQAIALNPNNAKAFIGMGIAYLHSGDNSMSRALFEEAMRLEPQRKEQLAPILAHLDEGESSAQ